jgi:hypothetical protein
MNLRSASDIDLVAALAAAVALNVGLLDWSPGCGAALDVPHHLAACICGVP